MNTNILRQTFLDFFQQRGHTVVPSSSLVPANDPTLLFTNAGMNQFKELFLGQETRPYTRATSSQCCVRAGGKHNDLENVGYTARHHTFFEMLGNFSFGDYFKHEAIQFAWDFLTQVLKISPQRLWVTVYKDDQEAEDIWLKEIKIDRKRFSRCGEKDNFWAMGDTGPCGPCSEIFYDHGKKIPGGPPGSKDEDGDRYVEIWNLVFMQYNRATDGSLTSLPKPSVDTGMGLERIAAVMQGVHENFDIDIFQYLINKITELTNVKDKHGKAVRVIADHIRATAFLIADGVIPANEGRGYVLRRIMRRAIRHAYMEGQNEPFFYRLVEPLIEEMGAAYPHLAHNQKLIERVIFQEEEQFSSTLTQGLQLLEAALSKLSGNTIPGEVVFKLYDTYGFPVDLTADIAREHKLEIDSAGFEQEMQKQRAMSQQASKFNLDYNKAFKITKETDFVGYSTTATNVKIIALAKDGEQVSKLEQGDCGVVVLDSTPFYAESGGQVGDQGEINSKSGYFDVTATSKQGPLYLHYGTVTKGKLSVDTTAKAVVDSRRQQIAINHSATHLLHATLREILGNHVAQKGSYVDAERLRFDFSHFEAVTHEELQTIEQTVNRYIRANLPVKTELTSLKKAKERGAMALFGEKYGAEVRMVTMGDYSTELCGGTHVQATGEIGMFKIVAESGIAAGIRRIEALTGAAAFAYMQHLETQIKFATSLLKTDNENFMGKLQQIVAGCKANEKELSRLQAKLANNAGKDLASQAYEVAGVKLLVQKIEAVDVKTLRNTMDQLKQQLGNAVILLATISDDSIQLLAGVTANCTAIITANEIMQYVAPKVGGKGGGRADMAQGGGNDIEALQDVLSLSTKWLEERLRQ